MKLKRRGRKEWFIVGVPEYTVDGNPCTECGPYENRELAESDMRGISRTISTPLWQRLFGEASRGT